MGGRSLLRQRTSGDCGVVALAFYTERSYDDSVGAVRTVVPDRDIARDGLLNAHVVQAAAHLGLPLQPTRRFCFDSDEGVLRIRFTPDGLAAGRPRSGHFVALRRGLIFCPTDGLARDWRRYLDLVHATPGTLLKGRPR